MKVIKFFNIFVIDHTCLCHQVTTMLGQQLTKEEVEDFMREADVVSGQSLLYQQNDAKPRGKSIRQKLFLFESHNHTNLGPRGRLFFLRLFFSFADQIFSFLKYFSPFPSPLFFPSKDQKI